MDLEALFQRHADACRGLHSGWELLAAERQTMFTPGLLRVCSWSEPAEMDVQRCIPFIWIYTAAYVPLHDAAHLHHAMIQVQPLHRARRSLTDLLHRRACARMLHVNAPRMHRAPNALECVQLNAFGSCACKARSTGMLHSQLPSCTCAWFACAQRLSGWVSLNCGIE